MAVSAEGRSLPQFFIFLRKRFKDYFLRDGPTGSAGAANSSGWMNAEHFNQFLNFFQQHVRASVDAPVLLVLDNHESHFSITGLDFCKENGIIVLSLPPHCSHKLQPLDRTVYGPLKKAINSQCDSWMTANPGKTMTIYDILGIIQKSLPRAATYENIVSGFECTGISPFNKNIFQDVEFLPSSVTDRDNPVLSSSFAANKNDETLHLPSTSAASVTLEITNEPIASSSFRHKDQENIAAIMNTERRNRSTLTETTYSKELSLTLETIQPFPKAAPRQQTRKERKRRKSAILTNSPEMTELAREQAEAKQKKERTALPKKKNSKNTAPENPAENPTVPKKEDVLKKNVEQPSTSTGSASKPVLRKSKAKKVTVSSDSDDDLKNICCVCLENILLASNNKQCILCNRIAHDEC
ncbi:uncharacterized protein LOC112452119 [Temnothorax curvispinosus]|uniref:Uncharacterized protein LOC112452119 n=1 Tax=Temnothorax curvispinosus TaxID=300111 RepID=A0A6J1PET2_9HYME|nr:uncharacterized protein LOC112452119 [Temnothorax curvispinosus]